MTIVAKNIEDLMNDIATELIDPSDTSVAPSKITDWNDGSKVKILSRAFARVVSDCWRALVEVEQQSSPVTATGESLDLLVNVFNVYRKLGAQATGYAVAIPKFNNAPALTIASDELFTFEFATFTSTSAAVLVAPYVIFPIQCTVNGAQYNLAEGTILSPTRTAVSNYYNIYVGSSVDGLNLPKGGLSGGADVESDDDLRTRFGLALLSLVRGTYTSVYSAIAALTWVKSFSLVEYDPMIGYLTAYIDDGSSNTTIDTVNKLELDAVVKENVAAGIGFRAKMLEKLLLDIKLDITVDKNYVVSTVETLVQNHVEALLNTMSLGETLYTSRIEAMAFDIPGVLAAQVTQPTGESVTVLSQQVFRPKSVTVNAHV